MGNKEYIGIIDGKIADVCSDLVNSNYDTEIVDYIEVSQYNQQGKCLPKDTWDSLNNVSLTDAPIRTAPKEKTPLELKIEELEARIQVLEDK